MGWKNLFKRKSKIDINEKSLFSNLSLNDDTLILDNNYDNDFNSNTHSESQSTQTIIINGKKYTKTQRTMNGKIIEESGYIPENIDKNFNYSNSNNIREVKVVK